MLLLTPEERLEPERETPVRPVEFARRATVVLRVLVPAAELRVAAETERVAGTAPELRPDPERTVRLREPNIGSRPPTRRVWSETRF